MSRNTGLVFPFCWRVKTVLARAADPSTAATKSRSKPYGSSSRSEGLAYWYFTWSFTGVRTVAGYLSQVDSRGRKSRPPIIPLPSATI